MENVDTIYMSSECDNISKVDEVSEIPMPCSICNSNQTFTLISSDTKLEEGVMISNSKMKLSCGHILEMRARCYRPEDERIKR